MTSKLLKCGDCDFAIEVINNLEVDTLTTLKCTGGNEHPVLILDTFKEMTK